MILFYIATGLIFTVLGFIFTLKPALSKRFITLIMNHELYFIMGVLEIALGLGTLYFRDETKLRWFAYIIGFLLFTDGIFYLTSSKRMNETYKWLLKLEDKNLKTYGKLIFLIAIGYLAAGLF